MGSFWISTHTIRGLTPLIRYYSICNANASHLSPTPFMQAIYSHLLVNTLLACCETAYCYFERINSLMSNALTRHATKTRLSRLCKFFN